MNSFSQYIMENMILWMYVYTQQILKYIFLCKEYWVIIRLINLKIYSDLKIASVGVKKKKRFSYAKNREVEGKVDLFLARWLRQNEAKEVSPGDSSAKKAKGWG